MRVLVTGIKFFKGDVEGVSYDSTKLFCQLPVDDTSGNAVGFAQVEFKFGDSNKFHEFKGLKYPMLAELDMTQVVRSGKLQTIVNGMKPLGPVNPVSGELVK